MFGAFKTSFKLKNAYRVNTIIYSIKQFPGLNKIVSSSLYKNDALKILANMLSVLFEIFTTFFGKIVYLLIVVFGMSALYQTNIGNNFLHIFVCLTLVGGFFNNYMFVPTKDKYYAMILMNMDARKYTLSNYIYSMIRVFVGFLPFTLLFGLLCKLPLWVSFLLPLYVVMIKLITVVFEIRKFEKKKKVKNKFSILSFVFSLIFILMAYGLPIFKIVVTPMIFGIIFLICIPLVILSIIKLCKFNGYKKMYKKLLVPENVYVEDTVNSTKAIKETVSNHIELDTSLTSNKKGFSYFHELFVIRHKKILTDAIRTQSIVIVVIIAIIIVIGIFVPDLMEGASVVPLTCLPYFTFIMYILNRGITMTQAMFINCDHSMLTYRIYRTPKVVLGVFKERLKTLIVLNSIPALLISVALCLVLFFGGVRSDITNYIIIILSLLSMSIFFSVHYLVMYYLLQPYNISTEIKSSTYKALQGITYGVCYMLTEINLPTFYFGLAMILFSVVYSVVSLFLAYKYAPKTFKIRI